MGGRTRLRLSLPVKFALISLVPIVALGLLLARDTTHHARQEALHDGRALAVDVADLRIAPNLIPSDLTRKSLPPARARRLQKILTGALASSDVARAKLWAPDGRVVFSDDRALTGRRFEVEDDLHEALEGKVSADVTDLSSAEDARDRHFGKMVEVYVPLRFAGRREPSGVFELYVPYAHVAARTEREARHTFLLLLIGLGVLWLALFPIVLGASRRLRRNALEIRRQATHDALTGLPNRVAFTERVRDAVQEGGRGIVALIDVDRFKDINDTLGHPAGDELLCQVGTRLAHRVGDHTLVARLGGDEFALLSDAAAAEDAAAPALAALEEPFEVGGIEVHVEASVGVARFPDHGADPHTLLQHAEAAMYEAKRVHVRVAEYDPSADSGDADRLSLIGELRRAIQSDELRLHFQPKFDLVSERMTGVEALVRWAHPERGMLAPGAFVPLAEHTALIRPLTLWVLEHAAAQCRLWREAGHDLSVAVNLSAANLADPALPGDVAGILGRLRLPPSALKLEITESMVMDDPERARDVLDLLRSMGIGLSIDDFGTGHASLAYLQRLPVAELKIDRGFVSGMIHSAGDEAIVRSTIDMAHHLGLRVVAEGVEDGPTLSRLRELGCDVAQGFHLGRPVEADHVEVERCAPVPAVTVPPAAPPVLVPLS
jgi:diguanylate cyclase (GGDEF)-like protein